MTSRLQRKIALSQQPHHHSNNSSSNSQPYGNLDESFVSVGTALPSLLDSKKDANEFKPAWEQEVLDEQGRRRFHGAFTGGFSAGYFNSVGSKEGMSSSSAPHFPCRDDANLSLFPAGWTPSTFKSSRANRGNQAGGAGGSVVDAARQFMDDEVRSFRCFPPSFPRPVLTFLLSQFHRTSPSSPPPAHSRPPPPTPRAPPLPLLPPPLRKPTTTPSSVSSVPSPPPPVPPPPPPPKHPPQPRASSTRPSRRLLRRLSRVSG